MTISQKAILFISCLILMILYNGLETVGASSKKVKKPFVEFTSKLDDVEVLDDSGKASVTVTWNYLARHVKYQDKFSGFFVSFGKVDENDINCKGRRYTSYNPLVVKRYCYDTLKITKVDKQGKLRTTNDLKAKLKFTDLKFSDSGKYYCRLTVRTLNPFFAMSKVSEVNLRVVDLQINKALSTSVVQAKNNHEIVLYCVVKVVNGVKPVFEWKRTTDNSTVLEGARQIDTAHSSTSRLVIQPQTNNSVTNYTCTARTARTTATHTVLVIRSPRDQFAVKTGESYINRATSRNGENPYQSSQVDLNSESRSHASTGRPGFYIWLLVALLCCLGVFS